MQLSGEYSKRGEYHKYLDPNWAYYPYYIAKMDFVKSYIRKNISKSSKILDVGSGEGVLVEKLIKEGYNAVGVDSNYSSELVRQGDINTLPFMDKSFDLVLCLDVLEHLQFSEQKRALSEIKRVLNPGGIIIFSIPNLAHLYSRITFLLKGTLSRTANITKHPGDRPVNEFMELIRNNGVIINHRKGLYFLNKFKFLNRLFIFFPNLCFINVFICNKK